MLNWLRVIPLRHGWLLLLGLALMGTIVLSPSLGRMRSLTPAATVPNCNSNAECDDGVFCNGLEQCTRGEPRVCVAATPPHCQDGFRCSEQRHDCVTACPKPDQDQDGHNSLACGGDDCDDFDPDRYPSKPERCDAEGHDEDCNPFTYGARDLDRDGDDDDRCDNRTVPRSMWSRSGTDPDDNNPGIRAGSMLCDGPDVVISPAKPVPCPTGTQCVVQPNGTGVCIIPPPNYLAPPRVPRPPLPSHYGPTTTPTPTLGQVITAPLNPVVTVPKTPEPVDPAIQAKIDSLKNVTPDRPQEFRVEGAGLEAVPTSYRGSCPGLIRFAGKIQANGAGRVTYTFFRSDGATGPEGFVDFEGPGVKAVETSWTLGGDGPTHFEGWVAIRILSPNSYESNQAKFVLDCGASQEKQPEKQPPTQPNPGTQNKEAVAYQRELPVLTAPSRDKLEKELASLKSLAEKLQPSMTAAQSKLSSDSGAMEAEFRAIAQEPDATRRAQRSAEFQARYEPHLLKLFETAGLDLAAQRGQVITLLDLSNKGVKESKTLTIECCSGSPGGGANGSGGGANGASPSQATGGGPARVTENALSAPYTSAGTSGDQTEAYAATGELKFTNHVVGAASIQKTAFISQTLEVAPGTRRVRVSATFDPVSYYVDGMSIPPGYSSAEAIVNLRVMDGSRVVASDSISLGRIVTAVVGEAHTSGNRPVSLSCEFTRPEPGDATTYTLIAEIEGWAGVGGFSYATAQGTARLRQFQVYFHR